MKKRRGKNKFYKRFTISKADLRELLQEKDGSAGVLLTILFACLITLVAVFFAASKSVAAESIADAVLQNAGRSILAEYDRKLLENYGLIAFKGDGAQIEKDIVFYANASLKKNKTAYIPFAGIAARTEIFDSKLSEVKADLKGYSLMDLTIFENQLKEAAVLESVKNRVHSSAEGSDTRSENPTLRRKSVSGGLPSAGVTGIGIPDLNNIQIPSFSEIAEGTSARALTGQYILSVFNHANADPRSNDTFFRNEVEYILCGKMSDSSNYNLVSLQLSALRYILNHAALLSDPDKLSKISELSEPFAALWGIGEPIAFATIMESWIIAETANDINILKDRGNVAMFKTPTQWALHDIEAIANGILSGETVYPANRSGQDYGDYLRMLLFVADREKTLLRTMDLIQINMKGTYDEGFLLKDYYNGFAFAAVVDGNKYEYTESY